MRRLRAIAGPCGARVGCEIGAGCQEARHVSRVTCHSWMSHAQNPSFAPLHFRPVTASGLCNSFHGASRSKMRPHLSRNLSLAEEKSIPEIIGKIFKQTGNGKFSDCNYWTMHHIISNETRLTIIVVNKQWDRYVLWTVKNQNYLFAFCFELVMVYVRISFNYI